MFDVLSIVTKSPILVANVVVVIEYNQLESEQEGVKVEVCN